jgi:oxepin-CoA hydrolase/3-oxo-5,6-dehydrosuberyl-CoA semialdehyde dehydrogenase
MINVSSFVKGGWVAANGSARLIRHAITGADFATAGNDTLDFAGMVDFAKTHGGRGLAAMTFHQRAKMLKSLALYLNEHKQSLYDLSFATGATLSDHMIDVDGGIGTMFVYSAKGRRELPNTKIIVDGDLEQFGKTGAFLGQHVYTSKQGVAVHVNAFNFPVWGMLEKLAPALLAGVPSIVKPATATCYVTEHCVRLMDQSGLLPKGAVQLVTGSLGNTLDLLGCQDTVTFTGSAATSLIFKTHPAITQNGVSYTAEQDSLNASILGSDAGVDTPEFDLFIKEVAREMTVKAGQKCTAVRRILVPSNMVDAVQTALSDRLSKVVVGDPMVDGVRMGALVSLEQKADVLAKIEQLSTQANIVFGGQDGFTPVGDGVENGAFVAPVLLRCDAPETADIIHSTEAFGPVSTILPYDTLEGAARIANMGQGSLVASVFTHDPDAALELTQAIGAYHGRLYFNNRDSAKESTGHGSPMPHMVHGGPGRAGGGEELGGIRGVKHYMQRTAIQGSPQILQSITQTWIQGAAQREHDTHPFQRQFNDLALGDTLFSKSREITLEDIEHFAHFTGDTFYAHMDADAAKRNPFFPDRVAHGYLLVSFAAGLFVEPNEGPVLANTGLDNLRFKKPVVAGDHLKVALTVMQKSPRNPEYGEVRWAVRLTNQDDEVIADYELLTMVAL